MVRVFQIKKEDIIADVRTAQLEKIAMQLSKTAYAALIRVLMENVNK